MSKRKKTPKLKDPPKAQKAQGTTTKRTPQSAFDSAAGKDIYQAEKVVAERMAKGGVAQFLVKWGGYESKSNTEVGCRGM